MNWSTTPVAKWRRLLLEQVSDRLKAELPRMIADVIGAHFRGTGRSN